jgi:hypothetical protein
LQGIERDTGETPTALKNKPVLNQWEMLYWEMYSDITGSRQWTAGGPAEIPYPVKILWLDENHIFDRQDREDYLLVVRALDNAYLEHVAEKVG